MEVINHSRSQIEILICIGNRTSKSRFWRKNANNVFVERIKYTILSDVHAVDFVTSRKKCYLTVTEILSNMASHR